MHHEVVAALIVESQRVLLGQRSPRRAFWPGVWDLFGGHVEPGEKQHQALVRELQEELGITPTTWRYLETISLPADRSADEVTVHLYLVTAWSGTPANRQLEEHSVIGWFSLEQAAELPLAHPAYPMLFARYLASHSSS
jgi:8-oxo-dGTP diphosphatase